VPDSDPSRRDGAKNGVNTATSSYLSYLPYGGRAATPNAQQTAGPSSASDVEVSDPKSQRKPGPGPAEESSTPEAVVPSEPEESVSPRLFFPHFVDHPSHFITFLETVVARRWGQVLSSEGGEASVNGKPEVVDEELDFREQSAVWNTLLELYLSEASSVSSVDGADSANALASREALEEKALSLLRQRERLPYDAQQALIVCTASSFVPGIIELYERLGMYDDIVRFWIDRSTSTLGSDAAGYSQKAVDALHKYGPERPHLYPMMLRYLSSSPELLERHREEFSVILDHVDREKIMPPIQVVQALSRTGVVSVGMVRDYFKRQIVAERQEIDSVSRSLPPVPNFC
jgi:hypothetical protein